MATCWQLWAEAAWRLVLGSAPDAPSQSLMFPYSPAPLSPPPREEDLFNTDYINQALAPTATQKAFD